MLIKEYRIEELEGEAEVSVRNIRYYTDLKLLPIPTYRGKIAIYTTEHLKRLKVIKRLQERHFTLEQIKGLLITMSEADMEKLIVFQDRVSQQTSLPEASLKEKVLSPQSPSGAMEYIETLLYNQNLRVTGRSESWERIPLDTGIELHIRQPVDPTDVEKIQKLVNTARDLFRKRKKGG